MEFGLQHYPDVMLLGSAWQLLRCYQRLAAAAARAQKSDLHGTKSPVQYILQLQWTAIDNFMNCIIQPVHRLCRP
eukprot:1141951-Pelagomonas_calceolata.AAC.2